MIDHPTGWRRRVRASLRGSAPYHVPSVRAEVKLDANESPYPPPPGLLDALAEAVRAAPLERYPDPRASKLRALVAADLGQPEDRLVFGNGSDELIGLLCQTFGQTGEANAPGRVAHIWPSFSVYLTAAAGAGMQVVGVPLGPRFEADPARLEAALDEHRPNILFLPTPNNPTGTLWPRDSIERVVARFPETIVVLDEAYAAYSGVTHLDLVDRAPSCVVLRTYSKVGLAALRLGVLVAQPEVAYELEKLRPPYNLGLLPQLAGELALGPFRGPVEERVREVVAERERLRAGLEALPGVEVFPSDANLLVIRVAEAPSVWQRLVERSILVRRLDPSGPLVDCLRITVGTPDENRRLLEALRSVCG